MVSIDDTTDVDLLRREATFWKEQHQSLVAEIRALPGYMGMEGLMGTAYMHSGGLAPSPVESRNIRIVLSQKKEQHD